MSDLETRLHDLESKALSALAQANDSAQLEATRKQFFGKKSELTQISRGMGALAPDERPRVGQMVNATRDKLEATLTQRAQ